MKFQVDMEALSPLALAKDRSTLNYQGCQDYIPGASFRGGLAGWYLQEGGGEDPLFKELFLSGRCRFGPFYPVNRGTNSEPIPLTARTCKTFPGFKRHDEAHGVKDLLLPLLAVKKDVYGDNEKLDYCPRCARPPLMPVGGFMEKAADDQWDKVSLKKLVITRTAINDLTGTVDEGQLYSFFALAEGQRFSGEVEIDDQWAGAAEELFAEQEIKLRVGRGKTRGLGVLRITGVTLKAGEDSPVGLKVEGFNRALGRYVGGEEDGLYFSITLKSDTILRDLFFRPLAGIDGEELAKILGIKGSIQLEHSSLNTSLVQGWNYLQGLPREDCLAINKGSVFLYKTRDVDREELLEKLAVLERTGVGLRREEGFGKLSVCDSFHWESEQW